ncbi:SDR family NAD(P)-dependent oxidoreductase [Streptomyces sp. G44]|nr:SDR family NAD(P)-dependent oxidoreductase [Streptomyces sp. G44]
MGSGGFAAGPAERAVAVIGTSCRLPGGINDLDALWSALAAGRDLITEVPADRFASERFVDPSMPRPGKSYTGAGGFLQDVGSFDADYFGIAPREAAQMDPQQRLLLEMAAETLDDAGISPQALAGSDTAVFVGISDHSYGALQMLSPRAVNAYTMSGAASSIAANRLSHHFDLRGASMAVDTACSSSLVALVQAHQALLSGQSRVALVGGVNVLLSPYHYVGFCQASMLSPTGRCRSFSSGADGYVRAEGGGMVLLKRLDDALADGDSIHAVVVDAATGSDGRTPGLALPKAESQEALLRQIYDRCEISPDDVAYVEAHGTGTPVGDPIECHAIGKALGERRSGGALPIGSVKSNLGHSEPASGITGLLKAILVLRHQQVPPSLHAQPPSPHIDFASLNLAPAVESLPVVVGGRTVVGVNSFGFGGANAHVVLAAPPAGSVSTALPTSTVPVPRTDARPTGDEANRPRPVLVTARSRPALIEAMRRTAERLASAPAEEFYDLAYTACMRRGRHPHRAVVFASDAGQAAERLLRLADTVPAATDGASGAEVPATGVTEAQRRLAVLRGSLSSDVSGEASTRLARLAEGFSSAVSPAAACDADEPGSAHQLDNRTSAQVDDDRSLGELAARGGQGPSSEPDTADGAVAEAVRDGRCVFAFSGNGAQWPGMAADLLKGDAVFAESVRDTDQALTPLLGWSVAEELQAADPSRLSATAVAQPLLFTVQLGIVRMLQAQGIKPAAVVGHSVGEIAAAYVAGVLTLEEAALVVATRSRVQSALAGQGRMATVMLPRPAAEEAIAAFTGIEIACVNTGRDVTVAGPTAAVEALVAELTGRNVPCALLELDYAFHSAAMAPAREPLESGLAGLVPRPARIPMISTVTGEPLEGTRLDAEYWWRNMRQPVLFADAVEHLLEEGYDAFVDVGPHPVLRPYIRRIAGSAAKRAAAVATMTREGHGPEDMRHTTAALLACGAEADWGLPFPVPGRVSALPAYPWQRQRYWSGNPSAWTGGLGEGGGYDHPLLGDRMPTEWPTWSGPVEAGQVPWLAGHRVGGTVILPATGFAEMALAAGRRVFDAPAEVEHLDLYRALVVPWDDPSQVVLHVAVSPEDGIIAIGASEGRVGQVQQHARGRVRRLLRERPAPLNHAAARARCTQQVDVAALYRDLSAAGLDYGPTFQVLRELRAAEDEVFAVYRHTDPAQDYEAHPALLDGALQAGAPLLAELMADGRQAYLPSALDAVRVWGPLPQEGLINVRQRARTASEVCWDVTVTDVDGTVAAELEGCRLRRFDGMRSERLSLHVPVMRAAPHPDLPGEPSPLPGPSRLLSDCATGIDALLPDWHQHDWDRMRHLLPEAVAHGSAMAFTELLDDPAQPFTVDDLFRSGVLPRHRKFLQLLISLQEEHGLLHRHTDGEGWKWVHTDFQGNSLVTRLVRDFPSYCTDVVLPVNNLTHASELLRGQADPLEHLVSEGGMERLEQFFSTSPVMHYLNRITQVLVRSMVASWPADRPLRVLEVGAGTGGTTRAVLPLLPPERTRYTFSDVSSLFCSRAEKRLADFDFVDYRTFDLNGDLAEQGFTEQQFDIIIASNALHGARDLTQALTTVRRLLAPGGHLLAVETHDERLIAPVFGALPTFWDIADEELRPMGLTLPAGRWPQLLSEVGYHDVVQTGHGRQETQGDFSVLIAAAPQCATVTPTLPTASPDTHWIVVDDPTAGTSAMSDTTLSAALTKALRTTGAVPRYLPAPEDPEHWQRLLTSTDAPTVAIAFVLEGPTDSDSDTELETAVSRAAVLRALATAHARLTTAQNLVLWLITRPSGALPAPERPQAPVDAATWAVTRTLANEHPDLTVRRLSVDRGEDLTSDACRTVRELLTPGKEDEIALTRSGRFVPRILDRATTPQGQSGPDDVDAYALTVHQPGLSYRLSWTETQRPAPGPGEIVIAVRAGGLNYKDIMQTVGVLPADLGLGSDFGPGMECAGVVEAIGADVTDLRIGDRVAAFAPGALASHVRTMAEAAIRLPDSMTFAEAATLPVVFLTVHYSLGHLARLAPGEVLLVHGGAGGIGLAALQYARRVGADVIATAGDPAKRALLRALGVTHVLDSRTLAFAEQVQRITGGRGVDVVVNSLAGEAMSRSLEVLAHGGRFIELGKRDIYENKPLLLRPFAKNIAFFGVDLTALLHEPERARKQMREVGEAIRAGHYRPLLHTVHPAARVSDAFRLMQHSRHIGKIIVTFDPYDEPPAIERHRSAPAFEPRGTYLVTGGLSGFGAATACWLADRGARHLALVGRRGARTPGAEALIADLGSRGVHVSAHAADVTDRAAMERIARDAEADGHPLRGIVHCAMHLDDAPLTELTDDRFRAVLAPKLAGSHVLNVLTADREMDLFLAYSSATATVGHITQAPYAAGNLYLEALARHRNDAGAPACAVAWGAIGETGYVVRNNMVRTLSQAGIKPLTLTEAFQALDDTLVSDATVSGPGRYNWVPLLKLLPAVDTPRMASLLPLHVDTSEHTRDELLALLAGLTPQEAHQFIAQSLAELLADILQTAPDQIDHHRRVDEYGLDSLMATEMLVTLRQQYDIDIPPMELLRSNGTIADFARIVHIRLGLASTAPHTSAELPGPRTETEPATTAP